jgi:hypothetical protein
VTNPVGPHNPVAHRIRARFRECPAINRDRQQKNLQGTSKA